jgi:mannan polymerase II complex ANP1 subunit
MKKRHTTYPHTGRINAPCPTISATRILTARAIIRFQPRSTPPAVRKRRQLLLRLGGLIAVCLFGFFVWPGASILSIFSFGFLSSGEDFQLETVRYYDLSDVQGTARGWEREERILLCAPLRDAESHLRMFFSHLHNFTYPHHLIDLAFLVSDSKDRTLPLLSELLEQLQADEDPKMPFGEISIIEKDFGQKVNQDVESRHGFAAQASRRKLMAQARNWLLSAALRPYHSWVYWRDVDVETAPFTILEDLMRHNKDVIVPSEFNYLILREFSNHLQMSGDHCPTGLEASNPTI